MDPNVTNALLIPYQTSICGWITIWKSERFSLFIFSAIFYVQIVKVFTVTTDFATTQETNQDGI